MACQRSSHEVFGNSIKVGMKWLEIRGVLAFGAAFLLWILCIQGFTAHAQEKDAQAANSEDPALDQSSVVRPDTFGNEWKFIFRVAPVIPSPFR